MGERLADSARRAAFDQQRINQQLQATESLERERRLKAFGTISGYANAVRDEGSYQRMRPILQDYIDENGLSLELPATYNSDIIQDLLKAALGPNREQSLDIRRQNAETAAARTAGNLALGKGRLDVANRQADTAERRTDIYADDVRARIDVNNRRADTQEKNVNSQIRTRENPPSRSGRRTGQGAAPPEQGPPGAVSLGGGVFRLPDGTVVNAQGQFLRPKVK
jgi:hypothetical protein